MATLLHLSPPDEALPSDDAARYESGHGYALHAVECLAHAIIRLRESLRLLPKSDQDNWHNHRIRPTEWEKIDRPPDYMPAIMHGKALVMGLPEQGIRLR